MAHPRTIGFAKTPEAMSNSVSRTEKRIDPDAPITGPHIGRDRDGQPDHDYYVCGECGLETTDAAITEQGCFRCHP